MPSDSKKQHPGKPARVLYPLAPPGPGGGVPPPEKRREGADSVLWGNPDYRGYLMAACAAARRAMGTRKGLQDT